MKARAVGNLLTVLMALLFMYWMSVVAANQINTEVRIRQLEQNYTQLLTKYNEIQQTELYIIELYETQEVRD